MILPLSLMCRMIQTTAETPESGATRWLLRGGSTDPLHLGRTPVVVTVPFSLTRSPSCGQNTETSVCLNFCSCLLSHFVDYKYYKRQTTSL